MPFPILLILPPVQKRSMALLYTFSRVKSNYLCMVSGSFVTLPIKLPQCSHAPPLLLPFFSALQSIPVQICLCSGLQALEEAGVTSA